MPPSEKEVVVLDAPSHRDLPPPLGRERAARGVQKLGSRFDRCASLALDSFPPSLSPGRAVKSRDVV